MPTETLSTNTSTLSASEPVVVPETVASVASVSPSLGSPMSTPGPVVSTSKSDSSGVLVLPAESVEVTLSVCVPSASGGASTLQVPSACTVAVTTCSSVVPASITTRTDAPSSPLPEMVGVESEPREPSAGVRRATRGAMSSISKSAVSVRVPPEVVTDADAV